MNKFLLLFIISTSILGQDILLDEDKKQGLYLNFIEFRTNSPSIEGEIEFITNKRGKVLNFLINGDSIKNRDIIKNYWGFCKDSLVYVNVFKEWPESSNDKIPNEAYYPLNLGYYSYSTVQTSNANAALIGGLAGGLIGGLIVGGIASTIENSQILTINHQSGDLKIIDKNNAQFLLMDEQDLMKDFELARNSEKDNERILNFLIKYNTRKSNNQQIIFNEKELWPLITIARKPKKQTTEEIDFYVNGLLVGSIKQNDFFKDKIPYSKEIKIVFKVGQSIISEEIELEIETEERLYFIVSNSSKSPNEIEVKTSDATRTGYIIQELD